MDTDTIINWYQKQLQNKKIRVNSAKDLGSGYAFLQLIHAYHPKAVDLTKIYFKPKNHFEILQNYKLLLGAFGKLGWKKFDPQKYAIQKDKENLQMANYIKKTLTDFRRNGKNNIQLQNKEDNRQLREMRMSKKDQTLMQKLQQHKQILLNKIMSIEHVVKEAQDTESAKNLISKILDQ